MNRNESSNAGFLHLMPFTLFFMICGTSFLQGELADQSQSQDGNIVNQIFLSFSYLIAILLLLRKGRIFTRLLLNSVPLGVLLIYIGISATWSLYPSAVLVSFIHQSGVTLIAMSAAILWFEDRNAFFKYLIRLIFIYLLLTVVISHAYPRIGIMPMSRWDDRGGFWRGLTTHPNSLGYICMASVWAALTGFFNLDKKNIEANSLVLLILIFGFYCLHKTNSMTSMVLSCAIVASGLLFWLTMSSYSQYRLIKSFSILTLLSIALIGLYVAKPEIFTIDYFFKLIGRNKTLTGRTSLWETGLKGIYQKPYTGWSFDSLRSFLHQFSLGYGQLHNGYLDLTLRGGLIADGFFLIIILKIFFSLLKIRNIDIKAYHFLLTMVVAIIFHNFTEASFFRNRHILWLFFLMLYFYCIILSDQKKRKE